MRHIVGTVTVVFTENMGGPKRTIDDVSIHVRHALEKARYEAPLPYADFEIVAISVPVEAS